MGRRGEIQRRKGEVEEVIWQYLRHVYSEHYDSGRERVDKVEYRWGDALGRGREDRKKGKCGFLREIKRKHSY